MASLEFASGWDGMAREIASEDFTEAVGTNFCQVYLQLTDGR
jgi:hypothetical protein